MLSTNLIMLHGSGWHNTFNRSQCFIFFECWEMGREQHAQRGRHEMFAKAVNYNMISPWSLTKQHYAIIWKWCDYVFIQYFICVYSEQTVESAVTWPGAFQLHIWAGLNVEPWHYKSCMTYLTAVWYSNCITWLFNFCRMCLHW